ncbi:hypothetical protein BURC_01010 [Burkholderiaceae bacterium]|nr:hypothetical protein BURC_01010 [Burkholderiaceae bacterium]
MRAIHEPGSVRGASAPPRTPRARSNALFGTALAAALLGLTLLDVAPSQAAKHGAQKADADASIDCIVATAIFAGVSAGEPHAMP